ncbi:type 1 glutamine amidotransferase domain-containing protein [Sporolactobacillus kofuensis]|uniref:Type 1 glutamine amidotransferase domain-containing protein n=1 Tax=Sporolactobacillus kofuensis TaxID=269672 RepID=A0ABW1WHA0_9BACL|nr:type 1 glutamine amidotransferase domain-containing protein [Sporolactobacillus kofuensis]MCO7176269.1 type 1 glutamine amidotransferase [Sporolactobacillus kofuensis]
MSKNIAVLVTNNVEDVELAAPKKAIEEMGHKVTLIEYNKGNIITGERGTKFTIDAGIDEVKPTDFDGLLLPGGFSPDQLRVDDRFVEFVKYFLMYDLPLFAICHGPQFFIQTGLTKGRTLTAYKSIQPDLYYAGAVLENKPLVIDNNLVTSRTPDDMDDFIKGIDKILN